MANRSDTRIAYHRTALRIIADARLSTGEVGQTLPLGWDEFEVLRVVEGLQFVVGKWSRRQAVNFGSPAHFGGDNVEVKAVVVAATEVGEKYMDQQVSKALRSADYHSILAKIAKVGPDAMAFTKAQVESGLTDSEKRKFNNFLRKMKRLNVIRSGDVRGEYVFNTRMARLHI